MNLESETPGGDIWIGLALARVQRQAEADSGDLLGVQRRLLRDPSLPRRDVLDARPVFIDIDIVGGRGRRPRRGRTTWNTC